MLTFLPLLIVLAGADPENAAVLEQPVRVSEDAVALGEGLRKNAASVEVRAARAFGTTATGSNYSHDLWLVEIQGGWVLASVMEPGYWFGGNLEAICKFIAAGQDNPDGAYLFAGNGGFRYHFRTGTALAPFLCGSIGIAVTDIETPDASGKFQFNEQIGLGARYLLSDRHAITLGYDYWHVSNGGHREPNDGVNAHVFSIGFAWLF